MLAVLFVLGMLCPLNFAEIGIRLLDPKTDGVLASKFPNSFLLSLPNCSVYGNKSAELLYIELPSTQNKTESFIVPSCPVKQPGFLLQNQQIDSSLPARSGAMVVITVILSLAMVILLAGLIISILFSG